VPRAGGRYDVWVRGPSYAVAQVHLRDALSDNTPGVSLPLKLQPRR
jgi:hypothetical protein